MAPRAEREGRLGVGWASAGHRLGIAERARYLMGEEARGHDPVRLRQPGPHATPQELPRLGRRAADSQPIERPHKGGVALAEHLGELKRPLHGAGPRRSLESKLGGRPPLLGHGRQLEEVSHQHQLKPAEGFAAAAHTPRDRVEEVEELAIDHRDLVDNEGLAGAPLRPALGEGHAHQLVERLVREREAADPGKVVDGRAADRARGDAGRCRDKGRARVEARDDLLEQKGLAGASAAGEEDALASEDHLAQHLLLLRSQHPCRGWRERRCGGRRRGGRALHLPTRCSRGRGRACYGPTHWCWAVCRCRRRRCHGPLHRSRRELCLGLVGFRWRRLPAHERPAPPDERFRIRVAQHNLDITADHRQRRLALSRKLGVDTHATVHIEVLLQLLNRADDQTLFVGLIDGEGDTRVAVRLCLQRATGARAHVHDRGGHRLEVHVCVEERKRVGLEDGAVADGEADAVQAMSAVTGRQGQSRKRRNARSA